MKFLIITKSLLILLHLSLHQCASSSSSNQTSVYYPGIGNFSAEKLVDHPPLPAKNSYLPISPANVSLKFYLYTRENRANAETILWNSTESIRSAKNFKGSRPTKLIIHGYVENPSNREWMGDMKDAFLEVSDLNVLIVDWSGANGEPYGQATVNARVVGPMVGIQIQHFKNHKNSTFRKFHILGQSLGAHVSGFAGKFLNGSLGQITGLDPAGPNFKGRSSETRLWYTDAKFVDVIHVDAKPIVGMGMEEPCGIVDLYPNGAKKQPGCAKDRVGAFLDGGLSEGARTLLGCEHYRAWAYYTEAIRNRNNSTTKAYRCADYETFQANNTSCNSCGPNNANCVYLGPKAIEYTGSGNRNKFYLNTNSKEPWFG